MFLSESSSPRENSTTLKFAPAGELGESPRSSMCSGPEPEKGLRPGDSVFRP